MYRYLRKLLDLVALNVDAKDACPPYVVLIAGGTGSGKTTIARGLAGKLRRGIKGTVISMDDFYVGQSEMRKLGIPGNYDHPKAVDMNGLRRLLKALKRGEKAEKPVYNFRTHERCKKTEIVRPTEWVFVEGLFALHHKVRDYSDSKVFIECDEATMLERRIRRDNGERGRLEVSIDRYFFEVALPMHRRCVIPSEEYADIIADQDVPPVLNYHRKI
jgi:uridine kinase